MEEEKKQTAEDAVEITEQSQEASPERPASDDQQEDKKGDGIFGWMQTLVTAVLAVVLIFLFVAQLFVVQGPSMQNTLYGGDMVLVVKPYFTGISQGDVVVLHQFNADLNETIIKRVIATEGQTVDIDFSTGTVYVDGAALEEPYIAERTYSDEGMNFPVTVGEGEIFVMGDNRNHSTDSRSTMLGAVDERYVMGKAVFLMFPGPTASYLGEYTGSGSRDFSRIGFIE